MAPTASYTAPVDPFEPWVETLFERHLRRLTFQEIRKGLEAVSRVYVERRDKLVEGAALDGAGKRAAFAVFYGPLHFLVVRHVVRGLGAAGAPLQRIVELGAGTGASGAAWALEAGATLEGIERSGWAVEESRASLAALGVRGRVHPGDLVKAQLPGAGAGILLAYTLNELDAPARDALRPRLLEAARGGARVLVVEPIARKLFPWWPDWAAAFEAAGGRAEEWRFRPALPERLRTLDKGAKLDHRELTARSLYLG